MLNTSKGIFGHSLCVCTCVICIYTLIPMFTIMQFMLYLFSVIHYCFTVLLIYTAVCGKKLLAKIFSFFQALLYMLQKLISLSKVHKLGSHSSVVSIVTIQSLDDPGVKFWPGARDFSLHKNIQTGFGCHWAFCLLVLGTSSLVVNQPQHEAGHWPFYYEACLESKDTSHVGW